MPIISRIGAAAARGFGLFGKIAAIKDAYFNYVTLLLPGNGTNGAQNNTFLDSSSNAFTITRNGNTTQGNFSPFSQTGWGNYVSANNYLSIADNAAFQFGSGDYTIECWINLSAITAGGGIFGYGPVGGLTNSWALEYNSGTSALSFWNYNANSGTYIINGTTNPANNQWTHVAVSRSGNNTRLFVNGTQEGATYTSTYTNGTGNSFYIGAGFYAPSTRTVTGYISNLRIVKGTGLYTANFTPSTTPLTAVSGTTLLTCQANRFLDASSSALTITLGGTPSVQAFSPFAPTAAWSASTNGGSGYFDGSGDYLSVADNASLELGSSDFCIEGWYYPQSFSSNLALVSKRTNTTSTGAIVIYANSGSGALTFYASTNGSSYFWSGSTVGTLVLNQWNHFAVYRSGNNWYGAVNGTVSSMGSSANSIYNNADAYTIGGDTNGNYANGYIASTRFVIGSAIYGASNFTPPTAPLTAITNTVLLLSYTNGGIVDATAKNDLETVGNAQISTTQSKFGGSSMKFNGTTDYLVSPSSPLLALGTGDLTVEFWFYASSVGTNQRIVQNTNGGFDATSYILRINNSSKLELSFAYPDVNASSTTTISNNTWYHVALVRSGTSVKVYLNGTQEISGTSSGNMSRSVVYVGGYYTVSGEYFNGYVDDVRITKGVARYTANFTAPTAPFPIQ